MPAKIKEAACGGRSDGEVQDILMRRNECLSHRKIIKLLNDGGIIRHLIFMAFKFFHQSRGCCEYDVLFIVYFKLDNYIVSFFNFTLSNIEIKNKDFLI